MEAVIIRFDLTDEEWATITPLLPEEGRGPEREDNRKVLNGIFLCSANRSTGVRLAGAVWPLEALSIIVTFSGVRVVFSRAYSKPWPKNVKTLWSSLTVQ